MHNLLESLKFPPEYANKVDDLDVELLGQLNKWKRDVYLPALKDLQSFFERSNADDDTVLSLEERAEMVAGVAVFDGDGQWVDAETRRLSQGEYMSTPLLEAGVNPRIEGVIAMMPKVNVSLLTLILLEHVKPIFRANPHPSIHPVTGRKLQRPAGGEHSAQDFYEGQLWKQHPGIGNVICWCVRHCQVVCFSPDRLSYLSIDYTDTTSPHRVRTTSNYGIS
jgi:hypothetical protein